MGRAAILALVSLLGGRHITGAYASSHQQPGETVVAARRSDTAAYTRAQCPPCAEWNARQQPFRVHGNTWYVGTRGLTALLITSTQGHVLIDGGLPESAPRILANIRALGFRPADVRLILNSHAHYDHAGGIAALQRVTGARVLASPRSAPVIRTGNAGSDDPQFDVSLPHPPAARVQSFRYGDTVRHGPISLVPHHTGGHTPGGTTWSWRSCDGGRCTEVVYADSQRPISGRSFLFTRSATYPTVLQDFARGFATLESLRCDIMITPHPGGSELFDRVGPGATGLPLVDGGACRRYAALSRRQLAERVAQERRQSTGG